MNERLVTYFSLVNLLSFSNVQAGDSTDKKKNISVLSTQLKLIFNLCTAARKLLNHIFDSVKF